MGCAITREKIELDMLMLKLKRTEIKDERKKALEVYKKKTGHTLRRPRIPDYIDHQAMRTYTQRNKHEKIAKTGSNTSLKVNFSTKLTAITEDRVNQRKTSLRSNEEEVEISDIPSLVLS